MSKAIENLQLQKQEVNTKWRALLETAKTEERVLTAEEKAQIEGDGGFEAKLQDLNERIAQQKKLDELDARALEDARSGRERPQEQASDPSQDFASDARGFGQFLSAVAAWYSPGGKKDPRLVAASGMNTQVGSEGGFFVRKEWSTMLLERAMNAAVIAPRCSRIPIGADFNGVVAPYVDETSRVTGSRFGGVRVYWSSEAATVDASKPRIGKFQLDLEKLLGIAYATEEVLRDASALGAIISMSFTEEMSWILDDAIISGTGAGQPLGILNSNAKVEVAKETSQAADTIVAQNIMKMRARMPQRNRSNSLWLIHEVDVEPALQTMSIAVGTGGIPVYLPANGLAQDGFDTLYGRPVVPIEQAPVIGDVGDIMYIDPSEYLLIDKDSIAADQSIHVRFLYGETTFRFMYRVNGAPKWKTSRTTAKGSLQVSPFIALAARA